jgi:hypothetical protein
MKRSLLALLLAALPPGSFAQEAAPQLQEDPRAARFREVERGFFVGFEVGYLGITKTPAPTGSGFVTQGEGGFANGFLAGIHLGYDITSRLALAVFALGSNPRASASYGSFNLFAVGGDARFAFAAVPDVNGVERLFFYVHGRGGWLKTTPKDLFGDTDVLLQGGLGVEYFTRLRHFSVGLAADGLYFTKAKAPGFAVVPTLRYTF